MNAKNEILAAKIARELKNDTSKVTLVSFGDFCRNMALKTRKSNLPKKTDSLEIFKRDGQGRYCVKKEDLQVIHDREAAARHGNDPDARFDEWNFPGTREERKFIFAHDFGSVVEASLTALEAGKWVYIFGEVGNGKTSLAMRLTWEFLKDRPSRKASFVSMNRYSIDQVKREMSEQAMIRAGHETYSEELRLANFVILDDLDKVNYRNEHKTRTILDLVERLKKGGHRVVVTSQISLKTIYERYQENWDMKPLIDRFRQMCLILPEFQEKSKRRYENFRPVRRLGRLQSRI